MRHFTLSILLLCCLPFFLPAQNFSIEKSVLLWAEVENDPATITLHWESDPNATGFSVRKRPMGSDDWGVPIATLDGTVTSYEDTNVEIGERYEYYLFKLSSSNNGYGYITAGIEAAVIEHRGVCILVVDATQADALSMELDRLAQDIRADGWIVKRVDVQPDDPVPAVRDTLIALYNQAPDQTHSVFLLGHIPVPYSGNIYPDGHPDHEGAWPSDVYYADVDGNWTDVSINNTVANDPRNDNIPGDGKFDQSQIPNDVEMQVGRVDMANLPAFSDNETELLRQYLNKNHAFRNRHFVPVPRGLVENNFGSFAEGFAQNGYKNFYPLVGPDSVFTLDFRSTLQNNSYLWSYGCGGGSYTSCGGITNTNNYAVDSLQTIFKMLFGSYFGDWDKTNNLLRASIASGQTLTNAWAGRPNWQFHPMALGQNIGYCARISQNNSSFQYASGYGARFIHIALMGDPTLRMHMPPPPENVSASIAAGHVLVEWTASPDISEGYYVYRRHSDSLAFVRVTDEPVTTEMYRDSCLTPGVYEYMVRGLTLETTPSGTYFNLSQGAMDEVESIVNWELTADFSVVLDGPEVTLMNQGTGVFDILWDFGNGDQSDALMPMYTYNQDGAYTITLTLSNDCNTVTATETITIIGASVVNPAPDKQLHLFPNPAAQILQVETPWVGPTTYRLYDLSGKMIRQWKGNSQETLDLTEVPAGTYWLEAIHGTKKAVGKIQKS
jgi:hypothetical protein